ncbi:hypothetical protein V7146_18585 [Gottfriedia acidiceleris]|uniref:hypothetical protein n=1 Tax=Gottfriedia acidiceleris TaxID=371036 RepID=UPI002FFDE6EF
MFVSILLITISLFLSGCRIPKSKVEQPVKEYLKSEFNINDGYKILTAENDGECGCNNYAYVELNKPYRTYLSLVIDRKSNLVNPKDSDQVYLELFKGAYIEQHPEVINEMRRISKQYGYVKFQSKVVKGSEEEVSFPYPYENIELNMKYSPEIIQEIKNTKQIDTKTLLPTLKPKDARNFNLRYLGVVNFFFKFNIDQSKMAVAQAKDIVSLFQKSGVLTEGVYNIEVNVANIPSYALFIVDEKKNYSIIATPKYDDIEEADFYGAYLKKNQDN